MHYVAVGGVPWFMTDAGVLINDDLGDHGDPLEINKWSLSTLGDLGIPYVAPWLFSQNLMKHCLVHMMTSLNENIFHVTSPLWGESTGHQWIPLTKASDTELWCFFWSMLEQTVEQTIGMQVIWDAITLVIWDAIALITTSLKWYEATLLILGRTLCVL